MSWTYSMTAHAKQLTNMVTKKKLQVSETLESNQLPLGNDMNKEIT